MPASSRSLTTRPTTGADGLLLVDKPAGVSSHDVVNAARRVLGEKRIGHGGTLDPFATGLLVLLVGRATRLLQYVHDEPKVYQALVRFGAETDTEDLDGAVAREAPLPARAALLAALPALTGTIEQMPPAYSAKRVGGKRAYELARAGHEVVLEKATVRVDSLTLDTFVERDGGVAECRMRVECGGGTYVRSLARDLARAAGSAAHLVALRRERAGVFTLARSVALEQLRDGFAPLAPAIDALEGYPHQPLTEDEVAKIVRGIDVEARVDGPFAALLDPRAPSSAGQLVAFAERRPSERGDRWQPRVVMREATS
ncbi:MAG: tRNA pseudouridine(55) synthase TruB [Gemmatimonadetes bacterium]|nr:tRNA pseudouridine(55) synthase TruB [Gemmatimonadota bacterium]MBI3567446.1 tRNA pseudouridine(55) synthase TruB [Gemmatimonadota bacterium]